MRTLALLNAILYTGETEKQGTFTYYTDEEAVTDYSQTSLNMFGRIERVLGNPQPDRAYMYYYPDEDGGLYNGGKRLYPEVTLIVNNGNDRQRVELFLIEE